MRAALWAAMGGVAALAVATAARADVLTYSETQRWSGLTSLRGPAHEFDFAPFATGVGPVLSVDFTWHGSTQVHLGGHCSGDITGIMLRPGVVLRAGVQTTTTWGDTETAPASCTPPFRTVTAPAETIDASLSYTGDMAQFLAAPYVILETSAALIGPVGTWSIRDFEDTESTIGDMTMTVTYDPPTPTPEPASMPILLAGLGLAGIARLRFR